MALETKIIENIPGPFQLFEAQSVSDIVESSHIEAHYPTTSTLDNDTAPISFRIHKSGHFTDLSNSYLKIKGVFEGQATVNNKSMSVDDPALNFSTVNIFPHALFNSVTINVNNKPITLGYQDYAYKTYLELLLNESKTSLNTYFQSCGWYKDTAGHMDSVDKSQNKALAKRRESFHNRKNASFVMKIHSSLFMCDKVLIPQCEVIITLHRHPEPNFYLMHEAAGTFRFRITEAILMVQKLRATAEYTEGVEEMLRSGDPLSYLLNDPRIYTYNITQNSRNFTQGNLFQGKVPKRIIAAFVTTSAYNGTAKENPFNFQHFNIEEIALYRDGELFPRPIIRTNFSSKDYVEAYHTLMTSLQSAYSRHAIDINIFEYGNGFTIFSWDMSPDQYGSDDQSTLAGRSSDIRLDIRFSQALTVPVTLILYHEMDLRITLNQDKEVLCETV